MRAMSYGRLAANGEFGSIPAVLFLLFTMTLRHRIRIYLPAALLAAACLLPACGSRDNKPAPVDGTLPPDSTASSQPAPEPAPSSPAGNLLGFIMKQEEEKQPGCKAQACTHVRLEYPVFDSLKIHKPLADSIWRWRQFQHIDNGRKQSMKEYAKLMFEEFGSIQDEIAADMTWYTERSIAVDEQTERWLGISICEESYLGGAHPNNYCQYRVYSVAQRKFVTLEDIVLPGKMDALTRLGEKAFRKEKELTPRQSLAEGGFDFPKNKFVLPNNFSLGKKGLTLQWNAYEIAPYVAGATVLELPWADAAPLLRPEWRPQP